MITSRLFVLSGSFCPFTFSSSASHESGLKGSDSISFKSWVERAAWTDGSIREGMVVGTSDRGTHKGTILIEIVRGKPAEVDPEIHQLLATKKTTPPTASTAPMIARREGRIPSQKNAMAMTMRGVVATIGRTTALGVDFSAHW